ncbi:MAG: S9 family peptidase [Trueperaceae bacterium]|nr:S9 family peptidase [Trueperaceae bacterium]
MSADERHTPPATAEAPVSEVLHGREYTDPYRWLEGDNSDPDRMGQVTAEVTAWTDEQNEYTRQLLDNLPGRAAVEAALLPLMQVGSVTAPEACGGRYFYFARRGDQDQPLVYWREGLNGEPRVILDPHQLDPTGLTTITWISPSPDGRSLAYGSYRSGDENSAMKLIDVDSGAPLGTEIGNKIGPVEWLDDGSGFVYRNLHDASDPYSGRVRFHRLGTDVSSDPLLLRQLNKEEDEVLATTWGPYQRLSPGGRWVLLTYATASTSSNDAWLVDLNDFLTTGRLEKREVSVGTSGNVTGVVMGETLYLATLKGAPKGRVVSVNVTDPRESEWRDVVPERADAVIDGIAFAPDTIVVTYLRNASVEIEVFELDGRSRGHVRLPGIGSAEVKTRSDSTEAFVTFTSFNYPTTILRVDLAHPGAEPEVWERPEVPVDPDSVVVKQVWYPSKDGTQVSMFLVHRKDLVKDGAAPVLLTGYGGFNISETPAFTPHFFQWFDAGGILALPNLRGGGEYGDAWHEAGMLGNKQNVFDDFIAAAEWLIREGYTRSERLAIIGRSNGGLLTGAAVTQRPDLFGAVIIGVPLLDMLRYQHFLMARYWVPEYGSSENPEQVEWLAAYSPYQHVRAGTKYPAVMLTAGENDTRVHALHARKMAAALQAATASDPTEKPVILWVDRDGGHGQGKPLKLRLREAVDMRLFVMWQLGMLEDAD